MSRDVGRGGESAFDVAAADLGFAEQVALLVEPGCLGQQRFFAVSHRPAHVVVDDDRLGGLTRGAPVHGGYGRNDIADVSSLFALGDEDGPVVVYQPLVSLSRDIG